MWKSLLFRTHIVLWTFFSHQLMGIGRKHQFRMKFVVCHCLPAFYPSFLIFATKLSSLVAFLERRWFGGNLKSDKPVILMISTLLVYLTVPLLKSPPDSPILAAEFFREKRIDFFSNFVAFSENGTLERIPWLPDAKCPSTLMSIYRIHQFTIKLYVSYCIFLL